MSPGDADKPAPGRPCNPSAYQGIYGAHPERERVARAEGRAWFSPRPVLGITDPKASGLHETIYVQTCKGGRRGSPTDKISGLWTVYAPAGADPEAQSWEVLMTDGTYELVQSEGDEKIDYTLSISRPVKVRGQEGSVMKLPARDPKPEVCMVSWSEKAGERFRMYILRTLGGRCDDNSAVEFANRLVELAGR